NVHAGHDDVMGVADAGWAVLFARDAQEVGDLALIARRAAEASSTPFLVCQDGFLTTHTIENVRHPEPELMREFVGEPATKLVNMMDPRNPLMSGVVQNQDAYMKGKVAQRAFHARVRPALDEAFALFAAQTGRSYGVLATHRMEDAEYAFVGIGCFMETAAVTADWLRRERGMKIGVVAVTCFQPFPGAELVAALRGVRACAVLERMDDGMAPDNPLALRVKAAFADAMTGRSGMPVITKIPRILPGVGGLGSRDVRPGDWIGIAEELSLGNREFFSVGIQHETAVAGSVDPDLRPTGAFSMRGHSVGGYGSVTTNKVIATLAADIFDLQVQAYPKYGSEKKGLPTTYYLTVAEAPIRNHSELHHVDFIPMNDVNAFNLGNPLAGLDQGGAVFVQSHLEDPEAVWASIPKWARRELLGKQARLFYMDTVAVARELATDADLAQRMQGIVLLGIFLRVTPFLERRHIEQEQLMSGVEKSLRKYFGKRGERVVQDNLECVRRGFQGVREAPREVMVAQAAATGALEQGGAR
ncbi:MAG: 2-oxoacid:acceptor oxidoreductase family protein, partial [Planctomycetes bacterium]|nr:2-oxoacid:acceptor oxidoreductase family protein [Planctomycetota bacterium]